MPYIHTGLVRLTVALGATISVLAFILIAHAAGPWFVATTGNDANACLSPATACLTIQSAVNKASSGDTINIAAGTYDQGATIITVDKSLTILGPNALISPNGGARVAEAIIKADNSIGTFNINPVAVTVVFEGLDFQTDGAEMRSDAPGATITLRKNIFTGARADGMFFYDPNLTVDDNLFTSYHTTASETIQMGAAFPRVGSISITHNTWSDITGNGALNSSGQTGVVSGNTFDGVEYYGILVASDANVSANLTISNNTFNNITNPAVGPTGNLLTWGAGVRFYQANAATVASVTGNTFSNSYLGVSVRASDSDITGANIHVNRNAITGNTTAGILNAAVGTLDASCNWWGALSGPGPVGPGTGDKVSANVDFSSWLTTSDLAGPCNGPLPPTTVTIVKNIDGVHATAASANSSAFPMLETWVATNFSGTDVPFTLSPVGLNTPNEYEAKTQPAFAYGASYTTHEVTGGDVVGASCADGKPYALVGYSSGDTLALAQAAGPSAPEPDFQNLTTNKFVIVWNKRCVPPTLTVVKTVVNDSGGIKVVADFPLFIDGFSVISGVASTTSLGAHTVSETSQTGYTASIWGGDCAANGTITLASGENKTCTITNDDQPGTLVIKKVVVRDNGGSAATTTFRYKVNGGASVFFEADGQNDVSVASSTYSIVEDAVAGYTTTYSNSANANANCNSLSVVNGGSVTCTITNNDNTPSLTLQKVVINDNGGLATSSAWTVTATGPTGFSGSGPIVANGPSFAAGTYNLSESGPAGYTASDWVCVGGNQTNGHTVAIGLGQNVLCTVTNNDNPPPTPPPPTNACNSLLAAPAGYTLLNGTKASDIVTIAPFTMFVGKGGNDTVNGPADGNYIICTDKGNDVITLGNGDYTIDAGNGNNTITTGNGNGFITTLQGNDKITTGNGVQTINAGTGNNTIQTGDGNKTVTTGAANDKVTTGSGNDNINAGGGFNTIKAGGGNDTVTTGSGNDNIDGGPGTDTCNAGSGLNIVVNCAP